MFKGRWACNYFSWDIWSALKSQHRYPHCHYHHPHHRHCRRHQRHHVSLLFGAGLKATAVRATWQSGPSACISPRHRNAKPSRCPRSSTMCLSCKWGPFSRRCLVQLIVRVVQESMVSASQVSNFLRKHTWQDKSSSSSRHLQKVKGENVSSESCVLTGIISQTLSCLETA